MKRLISWQAAVILALVAAWILVLAGCDPTSAGTDPKRSRWGDPPTIYTFLNSDTGHQTAVRIEFPSYTTNVNVTNPPGFTFLRQGIGALLPQALRQPRSTRSGGGVDLPDPDEWQFDPWDWPDPEDDFPLPDPPDPFEDPFGDLPPPPDLPPFPDDELDMTNISDGTMSMLETGGEQLGYGTGLRTQGLHKPRAVTLLGKIQLGPLAAGIATSPDKKTLYVAIGGNGTIAVVDRVSRTVKSSIKLPSGTQPYAMASTPDGSRLYTGEFIPSPAGAFSIDLPSGAVKRLSAPGSFITQAVVTPDGTQVWFCSYFGNIQVYDVLTNTYLFQIPIANSWNVAFSADGSRAYVANGPAAVPGTVAVIDTATLKTIASIPVGNTPRNIRVSPSGRHVFVTNYDSNFISQIDTVTNTVIRSIPIGGTGASGLGFAHN